MARGVFSVLRNRSFASMVATQFLGAFNDNLFKQMLILFALTTYSDSDQGVQYSALAPVMLALPFILFSVQAGTVADRISKSRIIVLAKWLEIIVMLFGALAFGLHNPVFLLVVLFFMGTQSTIFGPAKYGILPEILSSSDLSRGNGIIQMTTFLAIIFGTALAGVLLQIFRAHLFLPGIVCALVAAVGTWTSYGVEKVPPADPKCEVAWHPFTFLVRNMQLLWRLRKLLYAITASTYLWFLGAVVFNAINEYGINLMQVSEANTGILVSTISLGIGGGCILAARLSGDSINFKLVPIGLFLTSAMMLLLFLLKPYFDRPVYIEKLYLLQPFAVASTEQTISFLVGWDAAIKMLPVAILLALLGTFYALAIIPIQTYIQDAAPAEQTGRILAMWNLMSFIGIIGAGGFYYLTSAAMNTGPHGCIGILAGLNILFALWCRWQFDQEAMTQSIKDEKPTV